MSEETKVKWVFGEYSRDDLMEMDPISLGALLRERTHHMIEVPLYPTLLTDKGKAKKTFGLQAQMIYDVWRERGFPEHGSDLKWVKRYLAIAEKIRMGQDPRLDCPMPEPFTTQEMAVVRKLLFERRSIRDFAPREIPDHMIEQILEAGRAAPVSCNLCDVRFVILKDPEEHKMIPSDINTRNSVIIVVCHDKRVIRIVGHDQVVPHNAGFDAAASADHMLLMAHALGLGGVWLTLAKWVDGRRNAAEEFRKKYGLPDYIEVDLHIAVGWTAIGSIKSQRIPLKDMIITKDNVRQEKL